MTADRNSPMGGSDPTIWLVEPPKCNRGVAPAHHRNVMRRVFCPRPIILISKPTALFVHLHRKRGGTANDRDANLRVKNFAFGMSTFANFVAISKSRGRPKDGKPPWNRFSLRFSGRFSTANLLSLGQTAQYEAQSRKLVRGQVRQKGGSDPRPFGFQPPRQPVGSLPPFFIMWCRLYLSASGEWDLPFK